MPRSSPSAAPMSAFGTSPDRYREVRAHSLALVRHLTDADATVQSMPDASPAKWHLAHTTWFFEAFVLDGEPWREDFAYLFNSYYEAEGPRHARAARGMLSRPALSGVLDWRAHVDARVAAEWDRLDPDLVTLGLHHEQQHQELLLTDILHAFSRNPTRPAAFPPGDGGAPAAPTAAGPRGWLEVFGGKVRIGYEGDGFHFDCEGPGHWQWLEPFAISTSLVTHADWAEFQRDGGYATPTLWLSDGWDWVRREGVTGPLYTDSRMTLRGPAEPDPASPVRHVSFYEAEAYARWVSETHLPGARLPTEFEWEHAARMSPEATPWNALWQWTSSAYLPYPGFVPAPGAVGEYNGKFMNGCRVLRGGSFATPPGHIRATYRNFFAPTARWQFTGVRLARNTP